MNIEEKLQLCVKALIEIYDLHPAQSPCTIARETLDTIANEPTTYWRPMDTAPKDGTKVFIRPADNIPRVAHWTCDVFKQTTGSIVYRVESLKGWMPIPEN